MVVPAVPRHRHRGPSTFDTGRTVRHIPRAVGVIDESGFPKKGEHSVGVARQWCGRLGKKDNCQVGVYLVGVTPAGTALLEQQIYLSEDWILDRDRRAEVGIPRSVTFRTKPEMALDPHAHVLAGVERPAWIDHVDVA